MKLAVIGSRTFTDYELLHKVILTNYKINDISEIISGGAIGADTLAECFAKQYSIKLTVLKPDWKKHGRCAGLLRNKDIINEATHVIAFWDGKSHGTKNSIDIANKLNKPIIIQKIT
jgi:hypothetical protein